MSSSRPEGRLGSEFGKWVVRDAPRPRARLRLVCFAYAGGGSSAFRGWSRELPETVELLGIELPGRGRRLREEPYRDMRALGKDCAEALEPVLDRPYALFGHSMGGLAILEVARELERRGMRRPESLFVAGVAPPHGSRRRRDSHTLPDRQLIDRLRDFDGTPPEVFANPELLRIFLPVLRADLEACETYEDDASPPLEAPVIVFGGVGDRVVEPEELDGWLELSRVQGEVELLPGGHFFINTHRRIFLWRLSRRLRGLLGEGG